MTVYAVGDIHGQLGQLELALERIGKDGGQAPVVFLGDYTDRGPDSRGVIGRLVGLQKEHPDWVFLKGNHDRMFEWFLETPPRHDPHLLTGYHWLHDRLGGQDTVRSYGVGDVDGHRMKDIGAELRDRVPDTHKSFLRSLVLTHEAEDLFFVHAGVRPGIPLQDQDEEDLVWIRDEFLLETASFGPLIVHGHTPVEMATHYGNRVNLDSGAGYGRPLTAAVFEDGDVFVLTENGRVPLKPVFA